MLDWQTFWSSLLGTTVPGLIVSILMLVLHTRSTRNIESHKASLAQQLADLQHRYSRSMILHQKRVDALIAIYHAFQSYMDFFRKTLYIRVSGACMDPMHEFNNTVDTNLIYLSEEQAEFVNMKREFLLEFWNWSFTQERYNCIDSRDMVQNRLDFEIPKVLDDIRRQFRIYIDPLSKTIEDDIAQLSSKWH